MTARTPSVPTAGRAARFAAYVAGGAALAVVLAACGGGGSSASSVSSGSGATPSGSASFTAVSGKVIAASATSAAVQETSGPQTVEFSSGTHFTSTVSTTRSSLATGDCVTVSSNPADTGSSGTATPAPTSISAKTITVTSTAGCATGNGGPGAFAGGGFPGGGGFTPPAGGFSGTGSSPRPFPTGTAFPGFGGQRGSAGRGGFAGRGFGGAFGTVTSISPSSITVKSTFGSSRTVTVKTTSATTYDATSEGTATDVKKGLCVTAIGSDDVSGNLAARSVSISSPVNGSCPAPRVFGEFGGRGFGSGGLSGGAGSA
ncbi:MAG TPA: hypothetical protein VHB69_07010 [Mycobacteriales bacterium]|nr:hypothetical protein [Mycobacteriales bacterium]